MARPRLRPGEHGAISITQQPSGKWQARTRYCREDGTVGSVTATAKRKVDAQRELDRKLALLRNPDAFGVEPDWTVQQLAEAWLRRREADTAAPGAGQVTGRRPLSPQTLGQYAATVRYQVVPRLGGHRLRDVRVRIIDSALVAEQAAGNSTGHMRTVLNQMFGFALRHEAIHANPMRDVERPVGRVREVHALSPEQARTLISLARSGVGDAASRPGPRRNSDMGDLIALALGTGARIGELLALTWADLATPDSKPAALRLGATLVEPRKEPDVRDAKTNEVLETGKRYVEQLHRQPATKSRRTRVVLLPAPVVLMLRERRMRTRYCQPEDYIFASRRGTPLWPNNVRTRLRALVRGTEFEGVTPHTLRRTVGTVLEREHGIYKAGLVLGHRDGSVTARHYVADHAVAPDVRETLDVFFTGPTTTTPRLRAAE